MNARAAQLPPKSSQWTKEMDDIILHNEDPNTMQVKLKKIGYKGFTNKNLLARRVTLLRKSKTKEVKKQTLAEQVKNTWSKDDDGLLLLAENAKEAVEAFKSSGRSKSAIEQRFYLVKKRSNKKPEDSARPKRVYNFRTPEERDVNRPGKREPTYTRNEWTADGDAILKKAANADEARVMLFDKTGIKYTIGGIIARAVRNGRRLSVAETGKKGRRKAWSDAENKIIIECQDNDEALENLKKVGINHRSMHMIEMQLRRINGLKKRQAWKLEKDKPNEEEVPFKAPVDFIRDHRTVPIPPLDPKIIRRDFVDIIQDPGKPPAILFPETKTDVKEELPCDYMNGADCIVTGTDMIIEFSLNGKKKHMMQIPFIVAKHLSIVMRHDINNFELKTKHTFASMEDVDNFINKK